MQTVKSLEPISQLEFPPEALGDFDLLAEGIFDVVSEKLGFLMLSISMYDKNIKGIRTVKTNAPSSVIKLIEKILGKKIYDVPIYVSDKDNLLMRSFIDKEIYVSKGVEPIARPYLSKIVATVIDKLLNVKAIVVVPITILGKSYGVFCFGSKSQDTLSKTEKFFLSNLSEQIGAYLRTSWVLKNAIEGNKKLVDSLANLQEVLDLKKKFLSDVHCLLIELRDNSLVNNIQKENIKCCLDYLQALFLLDNPSIEGVDRSQIGK